MVRSANPLSEFFQALGLVPRLVEDAQQNFASVEKHPDTVDMARERHPGFVATPSGRLVSVLDPDPGTILIDDIAHMLAQQNRWNGAARFPVSVAHHSVLCALECGRRFPGRPDAELACLLHDAAEAYCADLPRPVKVVLGESYRSLEDRVQLAIWKRFDVLMTPEIASIVKQIDHAVCRTEAFWLMPGSESWDWGAVVPARLNLRELPWERARDWFLSHFERLTGQQVVPAA